MNAELEELLGDYWDLAYEEGRKNVSNGTKANEVLHKIREVWNRRASPASVLEGQALWDSVYKTLRGYRMTMMVDSDGDGYPLIDAMSPEHGTVKSGIDECTYLADAIYNDLLAAAPTPPVSEDRKDADRYRWLRSQQIDLNTPHLGVLNSGIFIGKIPDNVVLSDEDADAAIDKAMEGK